MRACSASGSCVCTSSIFFSSSVLPLQHDQARIVQINPGVPGILHFSRTLNGTVVTESRPRTIEGWDLYRVTWTSPLPSLCAIFVLDPHHQGLPRVAFISCHLDVASTIMCTCIRKAWERAKVSLKRVDDECRVDLSELSRDPLEVDMGSMDNGRRLRNKGEKVRAKTECRVTACVGICFPIVSGDADSPSHTRLKIVVRRLSELFLSCEEPPARCVCYAKQNPMECAGFFRHSHILKRKRVYSRQAR